MHIIRLGVGLAWEFCSRDGKFAVREGAFSLLCPIKGRHFFACCDVFDNFAAQLGRGGRHDAIYTVQLLHFSNYETSASLQQQVRRFRSSGCGDVVGIVHHQHLAIERILRQPVVCPDACAVQAAGGSACLDILVMIPGEGLRI